MKAVREWVPGPPADAWRRFGVGHRQLALLGAARGRVEALKAESPDIPRQFEHARLTKRRVPRTPSRDDSAAQDSLRGLGAQRCSPFDPHPDQSPQVFLGDAPLTGATEPSMIVNAANENSPNKAGKPVNAKTARAAEAHPFPWSNSAQQHKRARPKRRPPRAIPGQTG